MSNLVTFDSQGTLGPTTTLLFNNQYYNKEAVSDLTKYVKQQYVKMANAKPKGRKELCELITTRNAANNPLRISEVIASRFFQSMQCNDTPKECHSIMTEQIVPRTMKYIKENLANTLGEDGYEATVCDWLAKFMESYMSEESIRGMHNPNQANVEKFSQKRMEVGKRLYKLTQTKDFAEEDLDCVINTCRVAQEALKITPNPKNAEAILIEYLTLFSMGDESLSNDVLGKLDGIFRSKFF